jgi:hypothetical protein
LPISQGLKAGLAAGVVYGGMIGLLHLGTLEACSSTQISEIAQKLLAQNSNASASSMFSTDVLYFPMVYGIWGLIYGVIYGAIFAYIYPRLPGSTSRRKGMTLGIPVFLIGVFAGPAFFLYDCSPSYLPLISLGLGLPVSFIFGYVLGMFYDSFGRLALEQRLERQKEDLEKADRSKLRAARFRRTALRLRRELEAGTVKWRSGRSQEP